MKPSTFAGLGTTAGGLVGRVAVGFLGIAMVVGAVAPQPDPPGRTRSESASRALSANRITLNVPEGQAAGSLTMVDESGRELAILTRGRSGEIGFVTRLRGGAGVCCWLKEAGTAFVSLIGTARETFIEVQPDGTATTSAGALSGRPRCSADEDQCAQGPEEGLNGRAWTARPRPESPE
jgi:hypothetical protein